MRISSHSISHPSPSSFNSPIRTTSHGLANIRSSMESNIHAQESRGLCGYLQNILKELCQFLSRLFTSSPVSRSSQDILEERVTAAKNFIAEHYRKEPIVAADENSVIITTLTYQGRSDVVYGPSGRMKRDQDTIHAMARQLLTRAPHAENDNGHLKVCTLLLTKNPPALFFVDSSKTFGQTTSEAGGCLNAPLSRSAIARYLGPAITSPDKQREIGAFISRWHSSLS